MDRRDELVVRCSSCSRHPGTSSGNGKPCMEIQTEKMARCPSCSRFVPVMPIRNENPCFECSFCEVVGCFGRKRRQTKYLLRSHGEMVTAVNNVSQVNANLLERISIAEERAKQIETKFAHMEQEMSQKEGQCKTSEAAAESTRKEIASLKRELTVARKEKKDAEEECQTSRDSVRELTHTVDTTSAELESVRAALNRTSHSLDESSKNRSMLTSEKQTLVSKINILQHELEVAVKKKHELGDLVDNHADYKSKVEAELEKLRSLVSELKEEKIRMEKDALCNTNYLQRELFRMAERYKRRQRTVDRLTADKENLMDSLRHKTSMYESGIHSWSHSRDQTGVPETSQNRGPAYDEHLNTKILELQLKLDRQDGLIRALEDRIQFHEPDFTVKTDEETAPYRSDEGEKTHRQASTSPDAKFRQEKTKVEEFKPRNQPSNSYIEDSELDIEKLKLDELTPEFTSTPVKNSSQNRSIEQF